MIPFFLRLFLFSLFSLFCFILPSNLVASNQMIDKVLFPIEDKVEEQFLFWHDVFFKYPSTSYVIHDASDPTSIVEVIDFKKEVTEGKWTFLPTPKEQKKSVYKRLKILSKKTSLSKKNLRVQQGISDNFFLAAKKAEPFMFLIEGVMKRMGLPLALSRIPFVESRFEQGLVSKTGASGVWQLMPRTAKQFLLINDMIDERNCFVKSTFAAASLLKNYFKKLSSWPLAITSYNHGITGIYKVSKVLKTKNFNSILEGYNSPRFQYASKNFYAEVMAAEAVYQKLLNYRLLGKPKNKSLISMVLLKKKLSLDELIKLYNISEKEIRTYNRSFRPEAFSLFLKRKLPYDFKLILSTVTARRLKHSKDIIAVAI